MSTVLAEYVTPSGQRIQARLGDLTEERVDAIVNAANEYLAHGGGVAGAISRRGGPVIQTESDRWVREHGPVPTGGVAVTSAGNLPCKLVIHAVGPVWRGGTHGEDELLRSAVWSSLLAAHDRRLASIALPAISSGIFGFPKPRCAAILVQSALAFCLAHPDSAVREIRFTNIDRPTAELIAVEVGKLVS